MSRVDLPGAGMPGSRILVACDDVGIQTRLEPLLPEMLPGREIAWLRLDTAASILRAPDCGFGAADDATRTAIATRRFVRLVEAVWRADFAGPSGQIAPDIVLAVELDAQRLRALALEAQAVVGRAARVWCAAAGLASGPADAAAGAWFGAALPWDPRALPDEPIAVV